MAKPGHDVRGGDRAGALTLHPQSRHFGGSRGKGVNNAGNNDPSFNAPIDDAKARSWQTAELSQLEERDTWQRILLAPCHGHGHSYGWGMHICWLARGWRFSHFSCRITSNGRSYLFEPAVSHFSSADSESSRRALRTHVSSSGSGR
jgi:hypothetical protein